jgi:enterobacteria phage integrase
VNRRRSRTRANFPRNLYESGGYFSWRHPVTGETFGLGRDRARAFEEALEANLKIAKPRERLVDRISGDRTRSVAAWETKYQAILAKRDLTKATRCNYRTFSRRMVKLLGEKTPIIAVSALQVSDGLNELSETLPKTAKALRAYMKLSFDECVSQGWRDENPVRTTRIATPPPVARARLTLDVFMRVYESAPTEWLRNAMALALVSAQRREDVARAQFKDFKDGGWWLTQASEKTDHPHRIFIPEDIRPHGFSLSLGEVVSMSRRSGVVSRYLVHQTVRRGPSGVGREMRPSTITRAFTEALGALQIDFSPNTPPTFHEIRSLALRLYGAQGVDVQLLAGHSDPGTTSIYLSSRGAEYVKVTV